MTVQTTLRQEIRDFVLSTITETMNLPLEPTEIGDDMPLGSTGLDLDSLGLIELMLRIETRFGVEFPETDIEPVGAMPLGGLVDDVIARGAAA